MISEGIQRRPAQRNGGLGSAAERLHSDDMTPRSLVVDDTTIAAAAERLWTAAKTGVPCAPVRDLIGSDDIAAAYAVQQEVTRVRIAGGAARVGRKVGLTSPAVQAQLGVGQPDLGALLTDMEYAAGDTIPIGAVLQPRAEAEIAFVLAHDLISGPLDLDQIRESVDYAVAAIEICGSRISDWDIAFGDTVADNASAGAFVLGPRRMKLREFEPAEVEMTMTIDGDRVSNGNGAACLGDPLNAVVWLARMARELGEPLLAGEVILSGALGPMRPVHAGHEIKAHITGLGAVTVGIGTEVSHD